MEFVVFSKENETYATVYTSAQKIIVAFKGTTTMEKMKTDINMKVVGISNALPTKKQASHPILSSLDWKNAKIHKGFGEAYSSVSDELIEKIGVLRTRKERPIYFTGHSLGASLATIASIDVVLSLEIEEVYAVTFGSPRCCLLYTSPSPRDA